MSCHSHTRVSSNQPQNEAFFRTLQTKSPWSQLSQSLTQINFRERWPNGTVHERFFLAFPAPPPSPPSCLHPYPPRPPVASQQEGTPDRQDQPQQPSHHYLGPSQHRRPASNPLHLCPSLFYPLPLHTLLLWEGGGGRWGSRGRRGGGRQGPRGGHGGREALCRRMLQLLQFQVSRTRAT